MKEASNKKSAIILLRHACDGGVNPQNVIDFNPNITVSNYSSRGTVKDNKVTVVIDRLGDLGMKEAKGLGDALPDLLEAYCPVSRIITEGPPGMDITGRQIQFQQFNMPQKI